MLPPVESAAEFRGSVFAAFQFRNVAFCDLDTHGGERPVGVFFTH